MDLKKIRKGFIDSVQNTVDSVATKTKEAELPNFKEVGEKTSEMINNLLNKKDVAPAEETVDLTYVSTRSAIKIIYYQMIADKEISDIEQETLDMIGAELDETYPEYKEQLFAECKASLDKVIDPEDYYDVLVEASEEALRTSQKDSSCISAKLLVWDLMSIVYSDKNCTENELRFLKHINRRLNIDKAVFLEMESNMLTILDIDKETEWVKTTNKPYLTIEAIVKELEKRRITILQSVMDLIEL